MAYESIPVLSKVKIGEKYYYLKDADARALLDIVVADYLKGADKTELDNKITALAGRVTTIEGDYVKAADLAAAVKDEADRAKEAEKALADRLDVIEGEDAGSIKKAVADEADARDAAIEAAIEDLAVNDAAVAGQYVSAVSEIDGKIQVTRTDLPVAAEYSLAKEGTTPEGLAARYYLTKDNVKVGEYIDIAKDQFLKDASFIASATEADKAIDPTVVVGDPYIKFTFQTTGADKITYVAVKGLVDVYTAGDAIDITDNEISVKVKANDPYIEIDGNDQIATKGIDTAISTAVAAEAGIARAAEQANATAISDEVTRATNKEAELNTAIGAEKTRAEAAEKANADAITAIKDGTTIDSFADVESALANKADHDDLDDLAERVTTAEDDIDTLEGRMDTAEDDIDILQTDMTQAQADIAANTEAISDEEDRATGQEAAIRFEFAAADDLKVDKTQTIAGIDLADDITVTEMQNALGLEDLAYSNTASGTGTVASQTIQGVKATGGISGSAAITMDYAATNVKSTGSVIAEGSVTLNAFTQTSTAATLTKDDYTPAGSVAVATTEVEASKVIDAGTAYSITNGNAVKGTDTKSKFVKKAMNMTVGTGTDAECLIISEVATTDTNFYADAVTAAGDVTYTAPVLSGALPTFTSVKADKVGEATFTGTEVKNALVTAVNYDKATANGATFNGTSVGVEVNGSYDKANTPAGTVTVNNVSLDVGDIVVPAQTVAVTVRPDAE